MLLMMKMQTFFHHFQDLLSSPFAAATKGLQENHLKKFAKLKQLKKVV